MNGLFGPSGKPLQPQDEKQENIPVAVMALVKTEVNSAMDGIRHDQRQGLKKQAFAGAMIVVLFLIGNVVFWIVQPDMVMKWTKEAVQERLREPMIRAAANEMLTNDVAPYVEKNLAETKAGMDSLTKNLAESQVSIAQQNIGIDALKKELAASEAVAASLNEELNATKTQVSNLLFTVQNRKKERFSVADTNSLIIAEKDDGGFFMFIRLAFVPMAGSVDIDISNTEDMPGASGVIQGNIYGGQYSKSTLDYLKGQRITVKYYPSLDQSGGGQTMSTTTNGEVFIGSRRYGDKFKQFASP